MRSGNEMPANPPNSFGRIRTTDLTIMSPAHAANGGAALRPEHMKVLEVTHIANGRFVRV
jgi:hypothetical protein